VGAVIKNEMKNSKLIRNMLLGVLVFLSLGACFGGISFIIKPDGSIFQIPVEIINGSVFKNFLIPGIILLLTFGIFPIFIVIWLIRKPNIRIFDRINLLQDHHFSWTFSIYIGFGLIIWINIQTLIINAVDILHTMFSSLGILIVCLAMIPSVRNLYKK
jgi:hypothetical protein